MAAVIGLAPSAQAKRHARSAKDSTAIHVCYNVRTRDEKTHGNMRVLRPGQHCPPGTQEVSWNMAATKGERGAPGATGLQGPEGRIEAAGKTGATGARPDRAGRRLWLVPAAPKK
jgi:hypothetical protein